MTRLRPIGGGALCGKDFAHIDRAAAFATREAAVEAVRGGARECKVTVAYAPNWDEPLEVRIESEGKRIQLDHSRFRQSVLAKRESRVEDWR